MDILIHQIVVQGSKVTLQLLVEQSAKLLAYWRPGAETGLVVLREELLETVKGVASWWVPCRHVGPHIVELEGPMNEGSVGL